MDNSRIWSPPWPWTPWALVLVTQRANRKALSPEASWSARRGRGGNRVASLQGGDRIELLERTEWWSLGFFRSVKVFKIGRSEKKTNADDNEGSHFEIYSGKIPFSLIDSPFDARSQFQNTPKTPRLVFRRGVPALHKFTGHVLSFEGLCSIAVQAKTPSRCWSFPQIRLSQSDIAWFWAWQVWGAWMILCCL